MFWGSINLEKKVHYKMYKAG
ncbi:hypothetical protein FYM77_09130, partial [Lactobacillus salivarius]|nr:hypothetical protein [Ligilactobacillus salivarius]